MPYEIVMPRLGWNMEEGTLVEWLKQDGETVRQGEMVCTIEGDKAAAEIESFETGTLKIPVASPPPGQTVPVGTLLGFVLAEHEIENFDPNADRGHDGSGESVAALPGPGAGPGRDPTGRVPDNSRDTVPTGRAPDNSRDTVPTGRVPDNSRDTVPTAGAAIATGTLHEQYVPAISPRARRAAEAAGIDWRSLRGSGRSGRIVERDVLEAAKDGADGKAAGQGDMRQVIARRMAEAHRTTAPVTLHTEADVTALSSFFEDGFRPSWYDLMAGIAAVALAEHPVMNASWRDGVVLNDGIHIGIAVDTQGGVIAPVIRDVPGKSLKEISAESKRLIQAAQAGELTLDQIEGGTFTLTNLGMYDVDAFTPIIHYPQCAIIGLGRVAPRVVVVDESSGETGVRRMMALSLTFDHRIVDGAPAARFLRRVKQLAEDPVEWLGNRKHLET